MCVLPRLHFFSPQSYKRSPLRDCYCPFCSEVPYFTVHTGRHFQGYRCWYKAGVPTPLLTTVPWLLQLFTRTTHFKCLVSSETYNSITKSAGLYYCAHLTGEETEPWGLQRLVQKIELVCRVETSSSCYIPWRLQGMALEAAIDIVLSSRPGGDPCWPLWFFSPSAVTLSCLVVSSPSLKNFRPSCKVICGKGRKQKGTEHP